MTMFGSRALAVDPGSPTAAMKSADASNHGWLEASHDGPITFDAASAATLHHASIVAGELGNGKRRDFDPEILEDA